MGRGVRTLGALCLFPAGAAHADVTEKSVAGFEAVEKATIAAPKAKVYAAIMTPRAWWNGGHTWRRQEFVDRYGDGVFLREAPPWVRSTYDGDLR